MPDVQKYFKYSIRITVVVKQIITDLAWLLFFLNCTVLVNMIKQRLAKCSLHFTVWVLAQTCGLQSLLLSDNKTNYAVSLMP